MKALLAETAHLRGVSMRRTSNSAAPDVPPALYPRLSILLSSQTEGEFSFDNLLVRIHFIIVMIRWTGLAPWEFESPFPGSLTSTVLVPPPKKTYPTP